MLAATGHGYLAGMASASGPDHLIDSPDLGEIVVDAAALQARVAELGAQITADYEGRAPLLIGVLKGAAMFMTDWEDVQRRMKEVK